MTDPAQHAALAEELGRRWGKVDGALHAIGFAPEACLGQEDGLLAAGWDEVATALHVSAYSLKSLAETLVPLMPHGGSVVGLDFDAAQAWPAYDWMGVAKAALEATCRYLARDLGPRAGAGQPGGGGSAAHAGRPVDPRLRGAGGTWRRRAPLGWDVRDAEPVAKACVALLSDWFPATTGEILHVDGGAHAVALSRGEVQDRLAMLPAADPAEAATLEAGA